MTTTFKELPNNARFRARNINEIISNRGDGVSAHSYSRYNESNLQFIKRDEFGGHIIPDKDKWSYDLSVYYRIESDNSVETV
jgi:hypothetical protein